GILVASISTDELSTYVARIGDELRSTTFILYGRDRVLAHAAILSAVRPTVEEPVPALTRFGDPVLAALWNDRYNAGRMFITRPPVENRTIYIEGENYPFFYTELAGYSDKPLLVGAYSRASDFADIINRLILSLVAGAVAILGAIVMAVLIGRRLARPVVRISEAATLVGDLR